MYALAFLRIFSYAPARASGLQRVKSRRFKDMKNLQSEHKQNDIVQNFHFSWPFIFSMFWMELKKTEEKVPKHQTHK